MTALTVEPLPYHRALATSLETQEPGLWRWFSGDDYGQKYAESVKFELLRSINTLAFL